MLKLALPVLLAVAARGPAPKPPSPAAPDPDVRLTVAEESPERWRMKIENAGNVPVRVMADARLLTFEVTPAGAKKPVKCALPDDMRPPTPDQRALVMPPQRTYSESFDPRLYCFGTAENAARVPGASVVAHLGWATPRKGQKLAGPFEVEPLEGVTPQVAPKKEIVSQAWTIAAVTSPASTADAGATSPPSSSTTPPSPGTDDDDDASAIEVTSQDHADAGRAQDVGITVTVTNKTKRATTLLLRSETLAFDVIDPEGSTFHCGGTRAVDAPIRELFETIGARGHAQMSVLVAQICPASVFDHPGFYQVTAVLDTRRASGRPIGLATFDGSVTASKPTRVRLRHPRGIVHLVRPTLD